MAEVLIAGGGVVGMGLAMMLAKDGHGVTVLERDGEPPPPNPEDAFADWNRTGVNQFRLPHLFLSRYREILEAELPEVLAAIVADGAVSFNMVADAPAAFTGGPAPGDDRFGVLSGRRAIVERSVASVAERSPVRIRRGVAVAELIGGSSALAGVPHVSGVRTTDGEVLRADLVIDCCGRRSASPAWLEALGGRRPSEELEDSGFIYLGRHFRARDGRTPEDFGPALLEWGSISTLTLPADNGTWSVTVVGRSSDRAILGFRDVPRWERLVRSLPTVAPWLDGDPIEVRIVTMSKIEDRHREYLPGGSPVATGLVAVADAWACTNPSLGRGASIGMMHAQSLRDTLRQVGPERPSELAEAFAAATASIVEPWYAATLTFDRQRLAEMTAIAEGRTYTNDDPAFELGKAMALASGRDATVLRAFLCIVNVLETPDRAMARPGVMEKVIELGAGWRDEPPLGPDREQLVAMATE